MLQLDQLALELIHKRVLVQLLLPAFIYARPSSSRVTHLLETEQARVDPLLPANWIRCFGSPSPVPKVQHPERKRANLLGYAIEHGIPFTRPSLNFIHAGASK